MIFKVWLSFKSKICKPESAIDAVSDRNICIAALGCVLLKSKLSLVHNLLAMDAGELWIFQVAINLLMVTLLETNIAPKNGWSEY